MMKSANRSPVVIITNATSRADYRGAQAFGELKVLSTKLYSFTPNSPANAILSRDIISAVAQFDPGLDYVLPSGSAISTGLFLVGLFARGIRRVKVLMWSGNDQSYQGGILDLNTVLEPQNV